MSEALKALRMYLDQDRLAEVDPPRTRSMLDLVTAAEQENERLREALETIVKEYEGYMGTGEMLTDLCRAALATQPAPPEKP